MTATFNVMTWERENRWHVQLRDEGDTAPVVRVAETADTDGEAAVWIPLPQWHELVEEINGALAREALTYDSSDQTEEQAEPPA